MPSILQAPRQIGPQEHPGFPVQDMPGTVPNWARLLQAQANVWGQSENASVYRSRMRRDVLLRSGQKRIFLVFMRTVRIRKCSINAKKLTKELSKQAVISSYFIFLNRNERDWNNNVT